MRRSAPPALVVGLMMITAAAADAAIVNSLRGWSEKEQGWSGGIAGSYGASGGNSPQSTFEGSGRLQLRARDNVWRLLALGKRTTVQDVETANAVLGHFRHNYLLSERWATLAFLQYQRNPFQRLESRFLLGLGGRWLAAENEKTRFYLGAAQMWEQEEIQDQDGEEKAQRLSTFVSAESKLIDDVGLDFLVFYQPRWSDFKDWRMFAEIELTVELTGSLSLFTGYRWQHDATPPEGVEKTDWDTKTGFAFKF